MRALLVLGLALLMPSSAGRPAFAELRPGEQELRAGEATAECDRLAASPFDDERKSEGVEFNQIDVSRAIPACQDAVNAGHLPAIAHLGRAFMKKGDYPEAFRWLERAAQNGNATAMSNLGSLYVNGWGVPRDFARARYWYEKAAAKDNATGMAALGATYFYGKGVAQDYAKAREWYEKAAEKGEARAMTALGALYRDGKGVIARLRQGPGLV